jgi:hemoglobin-like flavoprotein
MLQQMYKKLLLEYPGKYLSEFKKQFDMNGGEEEKLYNCFNAYKNKQNRKSLACVIASMNQGVYVGNANSRFNIILKILQEMIAQSCLLEIAKKAEEEGKAVIVAISNAYKSLNKAKLGFRMLVCIL